MHINLSIATGKDATLPNTAEELQKKYRIPAELFQDRWKNKVEYQATASGYSLRSAGSDKEFDTEDDIIVESVLEK